jgi:uncharacterized protein (DUF58 family)
MNKNEKLILEKVKRIEFSVRKILGGLSLGVKNSVFRGQGMTFSDIRPYSPGDDIRNFAWQVMAKTGEPFVKEFEEERDLEVHVALDTGATMNFGGAKQSKASIEAYVLAFLGLSTSKSKDKFGVLVFSNRQLKRIPVKRGDDHVRRALFSFLEETDKPNIKASNTDVALEYFAKLRSKNCICVLVSDFHKPINRSLLARVKAKHQVKLVHIYDPYEVEFPQVGFLEGVGSSLLSVKSLFKATKKSNHNLEAAFEERVKKLDKISKSFGIAYIKQSTHDDKLREITKSLQLRGVYG